MYMRIYNNQLIKVYAEDDLKSSDIIGKLKGSNPAGFTIRDEDDNITFYDIDEISSKELQLIIRNSSKVTIAIKLKDDEVIDYFYDIAKIEFERYNRDKSTPEELHEWMNSSIDSGIINSCVWDEARVKVISKLRLNGFIVE